jgi:hypothetical protein
VLGCFVVKQLNQQAATLCVRDFGNLRSEMNSLTAASCSKSGMERRSFHGGHTSDADAILIPLWGKITFWL